MISNIYILDGGAYSGGGEAMFQLGCDFLQRGYAVSLIDARKDTSVKPPAKFNKYFERGLRYCSVSDIADIPSNAVLVPDSGTEFLFRFKRAKKIIYWLSYEFYDGKLMWNSAESWISSFLNSFQMNWMRLLHFSRNILRFGRLHFPLTDAVNLSGSCYTSEKLEKMKVSYVPLVHPIGVDFLDAGMYDSKEGRQNIVLYNPAKPSRLTKKLLERNRFQYTPIQSLTVDQMIVLFRQSKLYIDFGNFPGPERLPKETVFNGVNVLVWAMHAAKTDDVLIPERYKLSTRTTPQEAERMIGHMLDNYSEENKDFEAFREMVQNMQANYERQLDHICASYL